MQDTIKWYDAHLSAYAPGANIPDRAAYEDLYRRSIASPEAFWAEQARAYITWGKTWDRVLAYDFEDGAIEWFGGGVLNATFNCLDRHLPRLKDKVAFFCEGNEPGDRTDVTYGELHRRVNRFAALLKSMGVKKGDRVVLYLPMIIELPTAMLACARIGAIHCVVFTGFSARALARRINDCGARIVVTADAFYRGGKIHELDASVAAALTSCPCVASVILIDRTSRAPAPGLPGLVRHSAAASDHALSETVPCEPMDSEDPLFILYTSGITGRPKGLVHTHAGYLLYVAMTARLTLDARPDDIMWCTADIGWVAGHSYGLYGLLMNGLTNVLFEGYPFYPDMNRFWRIISDYRVNRLYTAPTILRALARKGRGPAEDIDMSHLRFIGTGGEPFDPDVWKWCYEDVGKRKCPVIDTYWQIETGGHVLAPFPGFMPLKPGSCGFPFPGVDPVILDDAGNDVQFPNQRGVLCFRQPFPGMARTIYGDHERFTDPYFGQVQDMYFTSDGAFRDEDGYYRITGRVDDVINVTGHRLGMAEVESILLLHDLVDEASVVGFPHPVKGQGIYAFVALKPGAPATEDLKKALIHLVRDEIGPFVAVDVIQWAGALPRTRSGKIIRHVLEKIASGKTEDLGDISAFADPGVIERLIKGRIRTDA